MGKDGLAHSGNIAIQARGHKVSRLPPRLDKHSMRSLEGPRALRENANKHGKFQMVERFSFLFITKVRARGMRASVSPILAKIVF